MVSEFSTWFVAQHGSRPGGKVPTWKLREDVELARRGLRSAEILLAAREEYDARETSALYAWNARSNAEATGSPTSSASPVD